MRALRCLLLAAVGVVLTASAPPMRFTPVGPAFAGGAAEYRTIWATEGPRIVAALEGTTGLAFPPNEIEAFVSNTTPMTSFDGRTMRLRAGYPDYFKRSTLVHELGHRLSFLLPRTAELDDHRVLFLFLYDVWTDLYGQAFADRMVAAESRISGRYDYAAAWRWALAMTREERAARLRDLNPGQAA
jgi:hypothetical protein